jgi:hypothetical protein
MWAIAVLFTEARSTGKPDDLTLFDLLTCDNINAR